MAGWLLTLIFIKRNWRNITHQIKKYYSPGYKTNNIFNYESHKKGVYNFLQKILLVAKINIAKTFVSMKATNYDGES